VLSDVFAVVLLMLPDAVPVAESVEKSAGARIVDAHFRKLDPVNDADADQSP
jgi:hypothetical protein